MLRITLESQISWIPLWLLENFKLLWKWCRRLHICISPVLGQGNHMVHHAIPGNWNTRKKPPLCVGPGESLGSEEEPLKLPTLFFPTWELWQNCSQVVKIEIQSLLFRRHDLVYNSHIPIRPHPIPHPTHAHCALVTTEPQNKTCSSIRGSIGKLQVSL